MQTTAGEQPRTVGAGAGAADGSRGTWQGSSDRTGRGRRGAGPWSLRTYLVIATATLVTFVVGAFAYGYLWSAHQAKAAASVQMVGQAGLSARSVAESVALGQAQVDQLAAQPGLVAAFDLPEGCTLVVSGSDAFPRVRIDIVRPDGMVGCSSEAGLARAGAQPHADSDWLGQAMADPSVSILWDAQDAVTGAPSVVIARPFLADGKPAGVVALIMDAAASAPGLADAVGVTTRTTVTVVDAASGAVVSTSDPDRRLVPATLDDDSSGSGTTIAADGQRQLFATADVPGSTWRVHASVPQQEVLADARGTLGRQVAVGLLALFVVAGLAWAAGRRIVVPLRSLTAAARSAGAGRDHVRAVESGPAELVDLARSFNTMLDVRSGHEARLAHLATHDGLTGLPNAASLGERLDQSLGTVPPVAVAALCIGLDRVERVGDSRGPAEVDRALVDVASWLAGAVRPGDVLARTGDADFMIVCEGVGTEEAIALARRLHDRFGATATAPALSSETVLHASIGLAVGRAGCTAEQLVREARTAMGHARSTGGAPVVFDDAMQDRATRYLETEAALQVALEQDELVVHYQPLVDAATRHIVGVEALVRWQHPTRGTVPPLEFIPIAEETGQIMAIGALVLRRACEQGVAWAAQGHLLRIAVNVAAAQLRAPDFAEQVQQVLRETRLAPAALCLEVTESALIRKAGSATANLTRLRGLGVHLSIDDFGTGYSSLSYLTHLPVDELKVDRSFVSRLGHDPRNRTLVEAVLRMADALDLEVIAEGVETEEQLGVLQGLGCRRAQGFLFARPQSADGVTALLVASQSLVIA